MTPVVKWGQKSDHIYLSVLIPGPEDPKVRNSQAIFRIANFPGSQGGYPGISSKCDLYFNFIELKRFHQG